MNLILILTAASVLQAEPVITQVTADSKPLPEVVAKGLVFLAEQGPAFQNKKGCITCHHGPLTVWAQREPAQFGYDVEIKPLDTFESKLITKLANGKKGVDKRQWRHTQSTFFILAQPDNWNPSDDSKTTAALSHHITSAQLEDGSWKAAGQFTGQSRPKGEAHLLQTMWNTLALARLESHDESIVTNRNKALDWIRKAPAPAATDTRALRLLVEHRLGQESHTEEILRKLLADQNNDGSWGWKAGEKADPWATGQTLYVLSFLGDKVPPGQIAQAQNYLATAQSEDGSWPTPTKLNPKKHKQEISTFFGTAWSVIGLARTSQAR